MDIIKKAKENDYWRLAMYCAVVAVGSGCRGGEIRNLQLKVFGNLTPHHDFASVELNILGTPECSRSEVRNLSNSALAEVVTSQSQSRGSCI